MTSQAPAHAADARVVVYTRRGCHLCDVALDVVADVCGDTGDTWKQVFIEGDDDLVRRFTDQVPVTFVDGAQHDFWRVDEERLRAALAG
ncbi:MAG TPA: glutaredoxin family protein [Aeromicrobium sp.]|nr:glutaredoxin family protein [Aeromicrobium sp.]